MEGKTRDVLCSPITIPSPPPAPAKICIILQLWSWLILTQKDEDRMLVLPTLSAYQQNQVHNGKAFYQFGAVLWNSHRRGQNAIQSEFIVQNTGGTFLCWKTFVQSFTGNDLLLNLKRRRKKWDEFITTTFSSRASQICWDVFFFFQRGFRNSYKILHQLIFQEKEF